MTASNTRDVFRHAVGKRVIGLYFEPGHSEHVGYVAVLVLEDKSGVAFADNGTHWVVSAEDVMRRAEIRKEELTRAEADLREVLQLEAVLTAPRGED